MKTTYKLGPVVALALLAGACDEGLTDLNKNPNAPEAVTPQLLFPQGTVAAVTLFRGSDFDMTFTSLWAQHIAKIQYTEEDRYAIRVDAINGWFRNAYSGPLQDFRATIDQAEVLKQPALTGPPLVMKSWTFGAMTDTWGDIPYSEANRGTDPEIIITPKYDAQKDIYAGILSDLTKANQVLTGVTTVYAGADPIYAGNAGRWQKFANSLRMRYAMRMSKADPAAARTAFIAANSAGPMSSVADDAKLTWTGDVRANENPIFNNNRTRDDHRVSETTVNTLKGLNDPRLAVYAQKAVDTGDYAGVPNGLTSSVATGLGLTKTSKIGTFFSSMTSPSYLMNYSEVLFLRAEAVEKGWIPGSAATFYNDGIRAAMQTVGVPTAAIDAYLAQPAVQYKGGAAGLTQIYLQKWISLFGQGVEAWAEYRRTGQPPLALAKSPVAGVTSIPRRLTYPTTEFTFNEANVNAAVAAMGGDQLSTRVWWDK
ncbi:MAG TPA: SusD/RagB family nutrient-binding outer membrane lipoprotein [Longimicrobiaceae bacterium]|nr:SusD/RagB family nutrient-binding outer membrane lipoprotein [Longimicrobiaceae bacterium]